MGLLREQWEGTSAVLLKSGLDKKWSAEPTECYCYLRNVQDKLSDGKTSYERRFGMPFNGPVLPFGAMIEYHPISDRDLSRLHQFGPKVLPGIFFLDMRLHAGEIWKGDMMVADIEELKEMDASELYARRLNAKEVFTPMKGEHFIFPVADGTVKHSGGDQVLRTSTLIRDRPDRREERGILRGESDGSPSTPLRDSSWYVGEARDDLWSISGKRKQSSRGTQSQTVRAERRIISYSSEIYRRYQDYRYIFTCNAGEISMTIGTLMEIENCQICGQVSEDSLY